MTENIKEYCHPDEVVQYIVRRNMSRSKLEDINKRAEESWIKALEKRNDWYDVPGGRGRSDVLEILSYILGRDIPTIVEYRNSK